MPALDRRRPPSMFSHFAIRLQWARVHVAGADCGPSEVWCVECKRQMMPLCPCDTHEQVKELMTLFPPMGETTSNVPKDLRAEGVRCFACLFCKRGAAATWAR